MSQNTTALMHKKTSPVYTGLDIAKASLQLDLHSQPSDWSNTTTGHAQLIQRLAAVPGVQTFTSTFLISFLLCQHFPKKNAKSKHIKFVSWT